MLVQDFLENSADRLPGKICLVSDGQRFSYREIETKANCFANALIAQGIGRGDRVVLYLPNCVELVVGIFGVLKAGGVFVVVNPTTKFDKLAYILNNCQAKAIIAWGHRLSIVKRLSDEVASLNLVVVTSPFQKDLITPGIIPYETIQTEFSAQRPSKVNINLDLACLIYTSGSTGEPKGVMSDHSNIVFAATSIIQYIHNIEDDIVIDVLPLSFDYGLYQLLMVFKFGGTLVLEKSFAYPAAILERMEAERVTGFPGVPTLFTILLRMDLTPYNLTRLRYLTNTAASLPPVQIRQIQSKFPGAVIYSMYGLTETKRTLYLPPDQLSKRPDSVGIAIPGTEVWIVDDQGNRLGPGEVGELVVRGQHVMRGYWSDPVATAERFRPGTIPGERFCYTGDLFKCDEDGYMYFVSRKDDIIKSRGEKVSPKEVENVLYGLDGVVEAAVIGVPDSLLGQAIKALVVVEKELTESEILKYCRDRLEDFMVPQKVEFVQDLPKTASGKIKKSDLR